MNMPGFRAEASLSAARQSHSGKITSVEKSSSIIPQACTWAACYYAPYQVEVGGMILTSWYPSVCCAYCDGKARCYRITNWLG